MPPTSWGVSRNRSQAKIFSRPSGVAYRWPCDHGIRAASVTLDLAYLDTRDLAFGHLQLVLGEELLDHGLDSLGP